MTHPFAAGLQTTLASSAFHLAHLVKMTLKDGTVIAMTDWDVALVADIDGGGDVTYSPTGMQSISAFSAQLSAAADDSELVVPVDDGGFSADGVRTGKFEAAAVKVGITDPDDLANASLHRSYDVGQVQVDGMSIRFELMGPEKRLEQPVGRQISASCVYFFGDNDCGISLSVAAWAATTVYAVGAERKPTAANAAGWFRVTVAGTSGASEPAWPGAGTVVDGTVTWTYFKARTLTGTVATVTDRRQFAASGISLGTDYFGEGLLTWLTGANAGQTRRIRSDNGAGGLVIHIPAFDAIEVGDTFTAVTGCRKRLAEDCIAKHNNRLASRTRTLRFSGDPFLAPEDITLTAEKA